MAIITISRGSMSGGEALALSLGERLRYPVVGREIVVEAARELGVTEETLMQKLTQGPGFWERMTSSRRCYLVAVQGALAARAATGDLVYHGHAGHLLLSGVPHVLRVRLIAPLEYRIGAAMERLRLGREAAAAHVRRVDDERARWTRFLYGIDWDSPLLYDLVVNLEALSVETACATIAFAASQPEFAPTAASRQALRDLVLACRVRAALAADRTTASLEIEVAADAGEVTLSGTLRGADLAPAATAIAAAVPGVTAVRPDRLGSWKYGP